jgi:hypothetical protein
MAKDYQITIQGHPSIYESESRELTIYFSEPDAGITEKTGMLLFVSDYGESAHDESFKQRRSTFADQYDLVTVQCDYFGSKYMGSPANAKFYFDRDKLKQVFTPEEWERICVEDAVNMNALFELGSKYRIFIEGQEALEESAHSFNDMGMMQALDNITAIMAVSEILKDNHYEFDRNRIIVYGKGHGAYLGYLMNALAPSLIQLLIDNSGPTIPTYLKAQRALSYRRGEMSYRIQFDYMVSRMQYDKDIYNISHIYKQFENKTHIVSFNEKMDLKHMISKRTFCESVRFCMYNTFSQTEDEGDSGMGNIPEDYDGLLHFTLNNIKINADTTNSPMMKQTSLDTKRYRYIVNYDSSLPLLQRIEK